MDKSSGKGLRNTQATVGAVQARLNKGSDKSLGEGSGKVSAKGSGKSVRNVGCEGYER